MTVRLLLTAAMAVTGCSSPEADGPAPSPIAGVAQATPASQPSARRNPTPADGPTEAPLDLHYLGRWDGDGGAYVVVTDPPQGGLVVEMVSGEVTQRYSGSVTAEGLRFMRGDAAEAAVLLPGRDGGRFGCLSLRETETYCR